MDVKISREDKVTSLSFRRISRRPTCLKKNHLTDKKRFTKFTWVFAIAKYKSSNFGNGEKMVNV